ncbi:MAG: YjbF family lipoprotein [Sulfitobacter sp.]
MSKRFWIIVACLLYVGACAGQGFQQQALGVLLDEPVGPQTDGVFPRFQPLLDAGRGPALDAQVVETGIRGGFLRESRRGNIETWLGTDGVSLIFDRGVLHGTRGIGAGMLASDVSASARAVLAGQSGEVQRIHTFLNGNSQAISRAYVCEISNEGSEAIVLDIGAVNARRMSERCRNLNQDFTNIYWVSNGSIVKSQQWTGDAVGMLEMTTVYNF